MVRVAFAGWVILIGTAAFALLHPELATGAVGGPHSQKLAEATPALRVLDNAADVELRFVQEDGPGSSHVRVELTPETRALNVFEARAAAQQAFLEALNAPGLGDALTRITVVVRLAPGSGSDPRRAEQTFVFLSRGGREWSILPGE